MSYCSACRYELRYGIVERERRDALSSVLWAEVDACHGQSSMGSRRLADVGQCLTSSMHLVLADVVW